MEIVTCECAVSSGRARLTLLYQDASRSPRPRICEFSFSAAMQGNDHTKLEYVDLGPGPNMHTWGAALLSKVSVK